MRHYDHVPELAVSDAFVQRETARQENLRCSIISTMGETTGERAIANEAIVRGWSIDRAEAAMRAAQAEPPLRPLGDIGLSKREIEQYSILRWCQTYARAGRNGAHAVKDLFETKCSQAVNEALGRMGDYNPSRLTVPREIIQRALHPTVGGVGYLAGTHRPVSFTDLVRARSVVSLGAEVLTLSGARVGELGTGVQRPPPSFPSSVNIPRLDSSATGYWINLDDPTAAPSDSKLTLGDVLARPRCVAALTSISRRLQLQSALPVDDIVLRDLAGVLGAAVNVGAIQGDETVGGPMGITRIPSVGTFNGTSLAFGDLADAQIDITDHIRSEAAVHFVTTPAVAKTLASRVQFPNTASPLWRGPIHRGTLADVPAMSTSACPASTVILGDWSQLVLIEWSVLEIAPNPYSSAAFPTGGLDLLATWCLDAVVRAPAAFTVATAVS